MKLTYKCLDDYLKWQKEHVFMVFHGCPENVENAIITDFFDLNGIHITVGYDNNSYVSEVVNSKTISLALFTECKSRLEAYNKAIEKANDVYNIKSATR